MCVLVSGFQTCSLPISPIALSEAGNEEQKAHWLPKIASGEARVGVAISEPIAVRDGAGISSAGGKLNGTALFALDFEGDDAYIVADSGEVGRAACRERVCQYG